VTIDGQSRGLTPLSVQLDPGTHTVTLQRGSEERTINLQVASGAELTQHYEFATPAAPAARTSTVAVTSDPPGARVLVDGTPRGTSPVTIPDLSVGRHRVTVIGENGSVERQVTTEAGATSSVVFSMPRAPAVSAGWLSVTSPFEVQVIERGEVIGTSASPRFMVPAGARDVDFVNDILGFKDRRRIEITQGATATVTIDARAAVNLNARPWADVLVDGRPVGQTPIANLSLTLGPHQILFRHPDLGERQQTFMVTANGPNRIAVDLSR
jgi:serine/threonine-protein kinase